MLLQPLFLPGLYQPLLNCCLYRGIHCSQSTNKCRSERLQNALGLKDLLNKARYIQGQSDGGAQSPTVGHKSRVFAQSKGEDVESLLQQVQPLLLLLQEDGRLGKLCQVEAK